MKYTVPWFAGIEARGEVTRKMLELTWLIVLEAWKLGDRGAAVHGPYLLSTFFDHLVMSGCECQAAIGLAAGSYHMARELGLLESAADWVWVSDTGQAGMTVWDL